MVNIYTDGACSGNPGPGGWGTILVYGSVQKELSGASDDTTNNRMELTGVIEGLSALKESCKVELYSDSKYVCDALLKGWLESWVQNGWKKADKKPVLNAELWQQLYELLKKHEVSVHWIKGHNGHEFNERCDKLAVEAYQKYLVKSDK